MGHTHTHISIHNIIITVCCTAEQCTRLIRGSTGVRRHSSRHYLCIDNQHTLCCSRTDVVTNIRGLSSENYVNV